jgi:hypothetical protein
MRSAILLSVILFLASAIPVWEANAEQSWLTRSGYYRVSYTSQLEPIEINRIHDWVVHVTTAEGDPVENAVVRIVGGMPEHNHGLPTTPRMTRTLGGGDYVLEGMRFHMNGYWELTVTVDVEGRRDTVVISLII